MNEQTSNRDNSAPESGRKPRRGRDRRHWLFPIAAALALAAGAGALAWRFRAPPAPTYETQAITLGAITRVVSASGSVNPTIVVQVGTYVSGVVLARYCDYNTRVAKGQLCAKIDPRPYQVVVAQNKANLEVAKAQLEKDAANADYARSALERDQKLVKTQNVSQDALDQAQNALAQAQAQVALDKATIDLRQANLDAAQINLDYTDIRSPVDGTVVSRNVEMGQTVAASFQTPTLFLIATDLTRMQVDANISESDIGAVKVGDKATFTVEAYPNRTFSGDVSEIRQSPQTIQNVVTYDVVISAANDDLALKPGMTATVRLVTDRREQALRAPDVALRFTPRGAVASEAAAGGARVYALRDGKPVPVDIATGLDDDAFTEIVSGDIAAGELVVTGESAPPRAGNTALRPPRT